MTPASVFQCDCERLLEDLPAKRTGRFVKCKISVSRDMGRTLECFVWPKRYRSVFVVQGFRRQSVGMPWVPTGYVVFNNTSPCKILSHGEGAFYAGMEAH